jgi:Uma2 family endonuclease
LLIIGGGLGRPEAEDAMFSVKLEMEHIVIPLWVRDLSSFRRWTASDDFPEHGRICYLAGEIDIDLSHQDIFTHVALKGAITAELGRQTKAERAGLLLGDGARLSNVEADISVVPDGLFASNVTLKQRLRLLDTSGEGYDELEGSPDMVLEVVSHNSVRKDRQQLRQGYWLAGIREYWLVDARQEPLIFDILRHTPKGYRVTPKKDGWIKSNVFGKSFRLTCRTSEDGYPDYTLEVR